jgi:23S rRNA (guanosine2251-2'-O)-methyltransferase
MPRAAMGKRRSSAPSGASSSHAPYWVWGRHACAAALDNPDRRIRRILVTRDLAAQLAPGTGRPAAEILEPARIAAALEPGAIHQGIALEVFPLEPLSLEDVLPARRPLVVLDQVTDPHNVGAILRSAAAFDAAAVILPRDHAAPQGGVMARAAAGALDLVPLVYVTNLARALEDMKQAGYWVAGLDGAASTALADAKLNALTALVLGAEGAGMRRLTKESCDLLVRLPMHPQMESLNVSNAAALALYEIYRAAHSGTSS